MNPSDFSTISFPGLGLEMNPDRVISIGPLNIHFYGLIIACGLLLAVVYGMRRSKQFGFTQDDVLDPPQKPAPGEKVARLQPVIHIIAAFSFSPTFRLFGQFVHLFLHPYTAKAYRSPTPETILHSASAPLSANLQSHFPLCPLFVPATDPSLRPQLNIPANMITLCLYNFNTHVGILLSV